MPAKKPQRRIIVEHLNSRDLYLEGNLASIIAQLESYEKYGDLKNIYLDLDAGRNSIDVSLRHDRPETDVEFERRLKLEAAAKEQQKKDAAIQRAKDKVARKALYEKLKREFENSR